MSNKTNALPHARAYLNISEEHKEIIKILAHAIIIPALLLFGTSNLFYPLGYVLFTTFIYSFIVDKKESLSASVILYFNKSYLFLIAMVAAMAIIAKANS